MAQVDILIHVEAGPKIGVPLAQGIVAMIKERLLAEGHILRRNQIKFFCDRCGEAMRLRQKTLVCDGCLQDEAADARLEALHMAPSSMDIVQVAEAAVL